MRITMNKAAADKLTADIIAGFKRVGDVADSIGRAAADVQRAADATPAPRRLFAVSPWAANAWADLLGRFTGR